MAEQRPKLVDFDADERSPSLDSVLNALKNEDARNAAIKEQASEAARRLLELKIRAEEAEQRADKEAHRADHDAMTGLLNKEAWERQLEIRISEAEKNGRKFGVVFIDLKDFKQVNDIHGHAVGDKVIKGTAEILQKTLRTRGEHPDVISNEPQYIEDEKEGRLGGDEFAIIVDLEPGIDNRDTDLTPQQRLDRIRDRIFENLELRPDLTEIGVGMSIGGAVWAPGMTGETLLNLADGAMYANKTQQIEQNGSYR